VGRTTWKSYLRDPLPSCNEIFKSQVNVLVRVVCFYGFPTKAPENGFSGMDPDIDFNLALVSTEVSFVKYDHHTKDIRENKQINFDYYSFSLK
jgi:hypothetical protein